MANRLFRKDIAVGTEGVVEGVTDDKHSMVFLKVVLKLPRNPVHQVSHVVNPRDLQLSRDYQSSKDLSVPVPEEATKVKGKKVPYCPLRDSTPGAAKTEANWHKLLSDTEDLNKTFWLKSRVAICLEALAATVPSCTDKDLLVCHKRNSKKGVWRDKLWTRRAFCT